MCSTRSRTSPGPGNQSRELSRETSRRASRVMRPDEHKKKQRADYKKKHGISNKKTASKEKHEATKTSNATETQEGDDLGNTSKVATFELLVKLVFQNVQGSLKLRIFQSVKLARAVLVSLGRSQAVLKEKGGQ